MLNGHYIYLVFDAFVFVFGKLEICTTSMKVLHMQGFISVGSINCHNENLLTAHKLNEAFCNVLCE